MNKEIYKIESRQLPSKLKNIKNPPKQLYCIGNKELLFENSFGIVGSRKISKYGEIVCTNFSKELALRNIPVVSGMARGTDSVAYETTLDYDGKTIAVLGSGLENIFPPENVKLFERIVNNNGLVISEYENSIEPSKDRFPERNRIVAGLSDGLLVVEASNKSGTSITAKFAKEQGKKVFAIPGRLGDKHSSGTNQMIKEGAILTTTIEDILIHYPQFINKKRKDEDYRLEIKPEYQEIYEILEESECTMEDLLGFSKYNIKDFLKLLSNMEIEGIIVKEMGIYRINRR